MSFISGIVKSTLRFVKPIVKKTVKTQVKVNPITDFIKQAGHTEISLSNLNKLNSSTKSTKPITDFIEQAGCTETNLFDLMKANNL